MQRLHVELTKTKSGGQGVRAIPVAHGGTVELVYGTGGGGCRFALVDSLSDTPAADAYTALPVGLPTAVRYDEYHRYVLLAGDGSVDITIHTDPPPPPPPTPAPTPPPPAQEQPQARAQPLPTPQSQVYEEEEDPDPDPVQSLQTWQPHQLSDQQQPRGVYQRVRHWLRGVPKRMLWLAGIVAALLVAAGVYYLYYHWWCAPTAVVEGYMVGGLSAAATAAATVATSPLTGTDAGAEPADSTNGNDSQALPLPPPLVLETPTTVVLETPAAAASVEALVETLTEALTEAPVAAAEALAEVADAVTGTPQGTPQGIDASLCELIRSYVSSE